MTIAWQTGLRWLIPVLLETRAAAQASSSAVANAAYCLAAAVSLRDRWGLMAPGAEMEAATWKATLPPLEAEDETALANLAPAALIARVLEVGSTAVQLESVEG